MKGYFNKKYQSCGAEEQENVEGEEVRNLFLMIPPGDFHRLYTLCKSL